MAASVGRRVQKRRESLRAQGLRPVQIWLPDTRSSGFAEECARQAKLTAEMDAADGDLNAFLDEALADLDETAQEPRA
ncbi:MAG: antitoxin MazE family protein [Allorhizobium sp.]